MPRGTATDRGLRRALTVLLLAGLVAAGSILSPARAGADADPASDTLLVAPVFYPYQPPTSPALQKALEGALAQLKARGLDLKVAIIDDPTDLGAVTNMYAMPQQYADFLDMEISFNTKQPLLVVMYAGFGVANAGPRGALSGLLPDTKHQADGLARSAIAAVVRLANANRKPIAAPVVGAVAPAGGGGGGASPLLVFGAPVLLVGLAAVLAARLRRRHDADQPPTERGSAR
jgi:hypothetical protein